MPGAMPVNRSLSPKFIATISPSTETCRCPSSGTTFSVVAGTIFGAATLQLPSWAQDVSPLTLVPKLPGSAFSAPEVIGLAAIATALLAAGLIAFRRRNLILPV
jgi:hypothetical protein